MIKYIPGVEIKIQASKKIQPEVRTLLMEKLAANRNVGQVNEAGKDSIQAAAELPVVQQEINSVIEEEGLKKSQFIVKKTKIRID